jgi:hypothetical protein
MSDMVNWAATQKMIFKTLLVHTVCQKKYVQIIISLFTTEPLEIQRLNFSVGPTDSSASHKQSSALKPYDQR